MFGKTVENRRCPATVSAPAPVSVVWTGAGDQPGSSREGGGPLATEASRMARLWEGGWSPHGRRTIRGDLMRKPGDRSSAPQPACVPRGTKEPACLSDFSAADGPALLLSVSSLQRDLRK